MDKKTIYEWCVDCGEKMETASGYVHHTVNVGDITIDDVEYGMCPKCGAVSLPHTLMTTIDDKTSKLVNERLFKRLESFDQISECYVDDKRLAIMLDVPHHKLRSPQSIKVRMLRNLIYNIDLFGKHYYLIESIRLFKDTGDGRFEL